MTPQISSPIPEDVQDLWVFLSADYSQIELRILAEVSNDPLFIAQFCSGEDIHCLVGHELTDWPVAVISKDKVKRRIVKEFHFGIVYGESVNSLYGNMRAAGIKVSRERVQSMYDRYFRRYKQVARFMKQQPKLAEKLGYVETLFGFRREIYQSDSTRSTHWANQAINTPVQGSAHQLVLIALALLDIYPKKYRLLQQSCLEVHDELVFLVRLRDLQTAQTVLKDLLEHDVPWYVEKKFGFKFRVPLVAESEAGFTLGTCVPYEGESLETFLELWRDKYRSVAAKKFESLLPERK